uniref:Uncharacterized protein n=1 Tax=Arundo donax TaxID=35708 RepID=A0A0A9HF36_ARUDO
MAASSHAEIKNTCVCSSSNWLSCLQLQDISFLGLGRIQTARNTIFIRVAAL